MDNHFSYVARAVLAGLVVSVVGLAGGVMSVSALSRIGFEDVAENHISKDAILYMQEESIVEGYPDGGFRPDNEINRAEFVKIALGAMKDFSKSELEECLEEGFSDLKKGEWYVPWVCVAKKRGLVEGYPDGTFRPAASINFVEASKIVTKAMNFGLEVEIETWEPWFTPHVEALETVNAIPVTVNQFGKKLARSEMAEMLWRVRTDNKNLSSRTFSSLEENTQVEIGDFPQISSCAELHGRIQRSFRRPQAFRTMMLENIAFDEAIPEAAPSSGAEESAVSSGASDDFSTTNIQVEGVDEADIVKNDGEYIYMVKDKTVRILKAHPPEELAEVGRLDLGGEQFTPTQLYLDGDQLVVLGRREFLIESPFNDSIIPAYDSQNGSKIFVVDVSDRTQPEVARELHFEGDYTTSRKVGNSLYAVFNAYRSQWSANDVPYANFEIMPRFSDGETDTVVADCEDVRYFPGFSQPNYLIVAALDLSDLTKDVEREVYLGSAENIFASKENLYVASTRYDDFLEITNKVGPWSPPEQHTVVYRFGLEPGDVSYESQGRVPGHILNQFSMDEHGGKFRIATTKGSTWGPVGQQSSNNVYVVDPGKMNIVGRLEGVAPGERIFSTRFMGDRLYMVTFRQVDPFFVIDMKGTDPKILGYLKIPGFSDYLHPFDENHILGFGKDTQETDDFGPIPVEEPIELGEDDATDGLTIAPPVRTVTTGVKVALFDVSDVKNPIEKHKLVIGGQGTYSELLNDHKALLFDKARGFMAFPIEISENYRTQFNGAHVYDIDLEDGFSLRGAVTHHPDDVFPLEGDAYYYDYGKNIQRIVRIGEFLYTISPNIVKALTIDMIKEAGSLKFD